MTRVETCSECGRPPEWWPEGVAAFVAAFCVTVALQVWALLLSGW